MAKHFLIRATLLAVLLTCDEGRLHAQSGTANARRSEASMPPLLLAHYMPWYAAKPVSSQWGWHWTMNHFRPDDITDGERHIAARYYPVIGPYDSGDAAVLEYHLLLMKVAGIDGVIVDWYGLEDFRDYALLHKNTSLLIKLADQLGMKVAICYEDQTIPALVTENRLPKAERVKHATKEIEWLFDHWFDSDCYIKLDGKPVLLSFGHSGLSDEEWTSCLSALSQPVAYFSQDYRRPAAVGGFGWPAPNVGIDQANRFSAASEPWDHRIPAAFPRFDDIYREAKVSDGYPKIADNAGRTFAQTMSTAIELHPFAIQLATWNDWGEGTQIEPSVEFGHRDLAHVQKERRNHIDPQFVYARADLNLPARILRHRRSERFATQRINSIVQSIVAGQLAAARRDLALLDAEQ